MDAYICISDFSQYDKILNLVRDWSAKPAYVGANPTLVFMIANRIKGLKIGTKVKICCCPGIRWELLCNVGEITEVAYVGKDFVNIKATDNIKKNLEKGAASRRHSYYEAIEDFEQIRMSLNVLEIVQKILDIE